MNAQINGVDGSDSNHFIVDNSGHMLNWGV